MANKKIYFDHSATTSVDKSVFEAMKPFFTNKFGNASSIHSFGQEAIFAVDKARENVARFLGCKTGEVIFTSGATESDNMVIQGMARGYGGEGKPHIITSRIEHPAILEPCQYLEKMGLAEVTYVGVNDSGLVETAEVEKAIKDNTILISIMYVNNEIGTIQPIGEIGEMVKEANRGRKQKIYFHTDAVQALNYCNCSVDKLGVDLLSLSGHKIYGPKGIGALYVRNGTPIEPITFGGHQEYGIRSGTMNTPGIVGLSAAIDLLSDEKNREKENKKIAKLRDYILDGIRSRVDNILINGDLEKRVPSNINFTVIGAEGESLLLLLDDSGFAISTGSACSAGSLKPSHVLLALGRKEEETHGSIRITIGKENTMDEADKFLAILLEIVGKLRKIAPK